LFSIRADMVQLAADRGASALIGLTCSCSHTQQKFPNGRHCGLCGQCIDRRIGILAAGQEANDPDALYSRNVFTGARRGSYDRKVAAGYARLATDLKRWTRDEIAARFNAELSRATEPLRPRRDAAKGFVEMLKRHAEAVSTVLEQQFVSYAPKVYRGTVDDSSLVRMLGRGEHLAAAFAKQSPVVEHLENRFARDGTVWAVSFNGSKTAHLIRTDGMTYLHHLLERPGVRVAVADLYRVVHGPLLLPSPPFPSPDELGEQPNVVDIAATADEQETGRAYYLKAIKEIDEEADRARRRGDPVELAEVLKRKRKLMALVNSIYGKNGLRRSRTDPYKKPRQAVTSAVKTAIASIKSVDPPLAQHLSEAIHTGTECFYAPQSDTTWIT
jgi:hypothetical protein